MMTLLSPRNQCGLLTRSVQMIPGTSRPRLSFLLKNVKRYGPNGDPINNLTLAQLLFTMMQRLAVCLLERLDYYGNRGPGLLLWMALMYEARSHLWFTLSGKNG